LAGRGTGQPGLTLRTRRHPLVAPLPDGSELIVAVEIPRKELEAREPAREYQDKVYRIWREVEDFTGVQPEDTVFVADRHSGTVTFAPALRRREAEGGLADRAIALAAIPPLDREIRLWYRVGGGLAGNVASGRLTVLKDPIPGLTVANTAAAAGGKAGETLENALVRGPQEFRSLQRAVTARDYELLALRHGGIVRARAFARAELWRYAAPGTVEIALVPDLPEDERNGERISMVQMTSRQVDTVLEEVRRGLQERSPLGTTCAVTWVKYKEVSVSARVVVHREEDPEAVLPRVLQRLHRSLSPLPPEDRSSRGWPFGKPLRVSDVYDMLLDEPGVGYVSQVRLLVNDAPDAGVTALAADPFHPGHWYATSGGDFFRTGNDAAGWERLQTFPGETIKVVRPHPGAAGRVAMASELAGVEGRHCVRISSNCGESWSQEVVTAFPVQDLGWIERLGSHFVLLASDQGLYELAATPAATPLQILVEPGNQSLGFSAIAVTTTDRGELTVAVAATSKKGVYLSSGGALPGTFKSAGLPENISVLEIQADGPRRYLWAGTWAGGEDPGRGCYRRELHTAEDTWTAFNEGWAAGSCWGLTFHPAGVFAASHRGGVLLLPPAPAGTTPRWEAPDVNCGLPNRDKPRFEKVEAIASRPGGEMLLAAGPRGIFRRAASGRFINVSNRSFTDQVTLPPAWLFCSGVHDLTLTHDHDLDHETGAH
ncbi:MAG: putative baseplate assembly protein, partial [Verrucomicrobium sp.]